MRLLKKYNLPPFDLVGLKNSSGKFCVSLSLNYQPGEMQKRKTKKQKTEKNRLVAIFDLNPTTYPLSFFYGQKYEYLKLAYLSSYFMNSDSCRIPSAERKKEGKKNIL